MASNRDLIQRAGGDEKVAKACNVSVDAIRKWRGFGRIPSKHWQSVAKLAGATILDAANAELTTLGRRAA